MSLLPSILAAGLAAAAPAPLPPDLAAAVDAFDAAMVRQDRPALERLLAEDFVLVSGAGRAEDKATYIGDLTDPEVREDPLTVLEPARQLWTGGAVLGGLARLSGADHGQRFSALIRFADVWALRDGRWRLVYSHTIRAGP